MKLTVDRRFLSLLYTYAHKREEVGVARIFMVISTVNPNICGIDRQMYLEEG
jgi:hypothetical protein